MKPSAEQLEQLSAYIDGELPPPERAMVERLLAGDAELRRELESMRRAVDAVRALPRERAPAGLAAGVASRIEQPLYRERVAAAAPQAGTHWGQRVVHVRRYAVAAVLLLAAGVGSWAFLGRGTAVHAPVPTEMETQLRREAPGSLGETAGSGGQLGSELKFGAPPMQPAAAPPIGGMEIARKDEKEDLRVAQIAGARGGSYQERADAMAADPLHGAEVVEAKPMSKTEISDASASATPEVDSAFRRGVSIACTSDADFERTNQILAESAALESRGYVISATQPVSITSGTVNWSLPRTDVEEWTLGVTVEEACQLVQYLMRATPSSIISGEQPGSSTTLPAADCDSLLAYFSADDGVVDLGRMSGVAPPRTAASNGRLRQAARETALNTTAPASQSATRRIMFRVVRPMNNATTESRGPANAP